MGKMKQKADGFGVVELILLILLLILLAWLGWYVYQSNQKKPPPASGSQSAAPAEKKSAPQQNSMANWQEYCSPLEKACFKYPPGWTKAADPNANPGDEIVNVTSLNGTVINWNANQAGVGNGCDPATDPIAYLSTIQATQAPNVFAVGFGYGANSGVQAVGLLNGTNGQAPAAGSTGQCGYIPIIKSKDGSREMWLSAGTTKLKAADAQTALQILGSYYYK